MNKATSTLIAAVAALMLSGGAYAQSNNTLATPSVTSPAQTTSGYGTPGATNTDSGKGAWQPNSGQPNSTNNSATTNAPAFGVNNSLARPSVTSPAAGQ
ncbi:hypothetical protein [Paraburkholderia sp. HP33-1]|uniref:hypothetical protein n=1 Tax=Paraburkholderia sp. HP33-1 TaxID=2883243 RepID=UPI001F2BFA7B|nr:hypothetical protein [Paraburkholderia sp. HP33-1]